MATLAAAEPPPERVTRRTREHQFFWGMSILIALIVFVGFSRTFYLAPFFHVVHPPAPPPGPIVYVHGSVFTAWIALLVTQSSLAASGQTSLHRRLGLIGFGLAPIVFLLGVLVALEMLRRFSAVPHFNSPAIFAVALSEIFGFSAPTFFAFRLRRNSAYHKRLMLIGTIAMMTAAFGRWPVAFLLHKPLPAMGCTFALLGLLIAYDLASLRRVHRATALGIAWVICTALGAIAVSTTSQWHELTTAILRVGA
ncbi:MAG TPA: hypothetical protein VFT61_07125 [Sphingomicrobium sp.]|nr:hypothetical protein [Sphingomicrobium sp.]